jgi:hypothetical protein
MASYSLLFFVVHPWHRIPGGFPAGLFLYTIRTAGRRFGMTGGPQKYTGRTMAEAHASLKITAPEWDAFRDILTGSAPAAGATS